MRTLTTILKVTVFVILVCAVAFFAYQWQKQSRQRRKQSWQNRVDETLVTGFAERAAALEARADFRVGTRRLYEIVESDDPSTRGRKLRQDGKFEIISYVVFPGLGTVDVRSSKAYVEKYNATMKRLHENPEELDADTWAGHPFEDTTEHKDLKARP